MLFKEFIYLILFSKSSIFDTPVLILEIELIFISNSGISGMLLSISRLSILILVAVIPFIVVVEGCELIISAVVDGV